MNNYITTIKVSACTRLISLKEKYPLDIACANVLIILSEHVSAYDDRKSIQEIMHLENKLKWRNTFLTAAFDHLEHNDLLIIIDPHCENDTFAS